MTQEHYDWGNDYKVRGHLQAALQADSEGDAVLLNDKGLIPMQFINNGWAGGLSFDASTFENDPTGCLKYTGDFSLFEPLSNVNNQLDVGSWDFDKNPMTKDCFYATFDSNSTLHEKLNPNNLGRKIAEWDSGNSKWVAATGNSSNDTENTMFCIPRMSTQRTSQGLMLSSDPNFGQLDAFSYGVEAGTPLTANNTWGHLAIGVYDSCVSNNKLMSITGVAPANNRTKASFNELARANGTNWHLWNLHEWMLLRDMSLCVMKSFDSQRTLGFGVSNGGQGGLKASGLCDTLGPFAGMIGTNAGGNEEAAHTPVKCFVENLWGNVWQFIDDVYLSEGKYREISEDVVEFYQELWAGRNLAANVDNKVSTNKQYVGDLPIHVGSTPADHVTDYNFTPKDILKNQLGWGLPGSAESTGDGNKTKATCDNVWRRYVDTTPIADNTNGHNFLVGGDSADGWSAGLSALHLGHALSSSLWYSGARLAFVF